MNANDHVLIQTLRHNVSDVLPPAKSINDFGTDFDLLRWLQGFDYNVDETAKYLRQHLEFRKISGFADENFVPNPVYKEGLAHYSPDPPIWSKEGLLLYVEFLGKVDHVGLMRHKDTNWVDLFKYRLHEVERVHRIVRSREEATGKQSGGYLLWDMQGYRIGTSLSNIIMMTKAVRHVGEFFAHHQVELVKRVVVIHPPPMFHTLWTMAAPIIPRKYAQKLKIYNGSDWQRELAQDFEESVQLPQFLGGTLQIHNSEHRVYHIPQNRIPLSDYFNKADMKENLAMQTQRFSVHAGGALIASYRKTTETPQQLKWIIFTNVACHFGVFRVEDTAKDSEDESRLQAVYPVITPLPASQHCPEMDSLEVKESGNYEVRLVNHATYNIFGKLHVDIRVTIAEATQAENVEYFVRDVSYP